MRWIPRIGFVALIAAFALGYVVHSEAQAMDDVIYLKEGSVVRGTIFEQMPGQQIMLQTRDGSIFVYETNQIDRIKQVQRGRRKIPGLALGLSLAFGYMLDGAGQFYNGEMKKGFSLLAWSALGNLMIIAYVGIEDDVPFEGFSTDLHDDEDLLAVGLLSRFASYTYAAVDAYRSAKRKNVERGYAQAETDLDRPVLVWVGTDAKGRFLAQVHRLW